MSEKAKNSIVDELYYKLYGEHQTKEGQALERLAAVAFKLLEEERNVKYDQQVRAKYSGTVYQIDGLVGEDGDQAMVEAKDYTVTGNKVGRADIQKLEGALTDLDIEEGRFVSATDYTNRAKPYAKSTQTNPKQNPIDLYHVRPSTQDDEHGRVKTIHITIVAHGLALESGKYLPIINRDFFETIKNKIPEGGMEMNMTLYQFYDKDGKVVETFSNISSQLYHCLPQNFEKGYVLKGTWEFSSSVYMDMPIFGRVPIDSIQYEIPTYTDEMSFSVNQDGKPVLLIKSEDGSIDKLITDEQLKRFKFVDGVIVKTV